MNTIIIFHSNKLSQEKEESLLESIGNLLLHLGSEPIQFHTLSEEETLKCITHEVTRVSPPTDDVLVKINSWCKTLISITGIPGKLVSKKAYTSMVAKACINNVNLRNPIILNRLIQMTENDDAVLDVLRANKLGDFITPTTMRKIYNTLMLLGYVEE